MSETGNAFSRNPNMCASCSSMFDGMEETAISEMDEPDQAVAPEKQNELHRAA